MTKTVSPSKGLRAAYWSVTILLCAFLAFAAFGHLTMQPEILESTRHLEFPARLMPFLGVLKLLAVISILIGYRMDITVGAYAGVLFYGLGAVVTHVSIGDPLPEAGGGIILIMLALGSYFLWKRTRGAAFSSPITR